MMAGENSMEHQDQGELEELISSILEIGSAEEGSRPHSECWGFWLQPPARPTWTGLSYLESALEQLYLPISMPPRLFLGNLETAWRFKYLDSTFETDMIEIIKHLNGPVPVVKNKKGHKWNMTEDEYHLWVSLDEETTNALIQKCPQKTEVVRMLRSEAQKDKATASPSSYIASGPSTSSPAESLDLKAAAFNFVAENDEFPPDNYKGIYELENTSMVGGQISSCGSSLYQYKPNSTVVEEQKENWLAVGRWPEEIITKESQWNETEDNNLWAHLDKETTDRLIQKCPGRAEVDNWLRSETPKGKAAVTLSSITAGERTLSAASHKQSANPILYHTSHGGNQADPEDLYTNISPSNQTDDYAAVSLDLDTATFTSITGKNESSPDNQKSKNDVENAFMVGEQIISTAGSVWAKESRYDMPCNAESLWCFLSASVLVSFISCFDGLLLVGHKPRGMVARLLLCVAYFAIAFAVLAISGLQLPDELRVWITGVACIVSLPAILGYALK